MTDQIPNLPIPPGTRDVLPDEMRELRRVVKTSGIAYIVELDPGASRHKVRRHSRAMKSLISRWTFGPLVLRTAPPSSHIAELARRAGWKRADCHRDARQPVYVLRLT